MNVNLYHLAGFQFEVFVDDVDGEVLGGGEDGEDAVPTEFFYDLTLFEVELVGDDLDVDAFHTVWVGFMYLFEQGILEEDHADKVSLCYLFKER